MLEGDVDYEDDFRLIEECIKHLKTPQLTEELKAFYNIWKGEYNEYVIRRETNSSKIKTTEGQNAEVQFDRENFHTILPSFES